MLKLEPSLPERAPSPSSLNCTVLYIYIFAMASQPRYDEGLEVAPAGSGPSAYYDQQQKQVTEFYGGAQKQVPEFYGGAQNGKEVVPNADNEKYYNGNTGDEKEEKKRICGLSALVFWILVVVAVLVVAGAVGGGVAGAMASKR